jgi:hypothetical protein
MPRQKENKELLVALLPRKSSLDILRTEGWYHIPVESAPTKRWPTKVMAFYQGNVFGVEERYKVRYFGEVDTIDMISSPAKCFSRTTKQTGTKRRIYITACS